MKNRKDGCSCLQHSKLPEWGKEVLQAQWKALVCLAEGKLDESLVRLRLLVEEMMDGSLV
jgi:hypothetical protein